MKEKIRNDLNRKYSKGTILIHWITSLLIIVLFPLGKYMEEFAPSDKMGLIKIHVILGLTILILTIFRSWSFFKAPRPDNLKTGSKFNDKLAVWVHNAFYFLLFGISISGISTLFLGGYIEAISSGDPQLILDRGDIAPIKGHSIMALILMLLLVMHVVGVVKHYIVTKENTLKRIV